MLHGELAMLAEKVRIRTCLPWRGREWSKGQEWQGAWEGDMKNWQVVVGFLGLLMKHTANRKFGSLVDWDQLCRVRVSPSTKAMHTGTNNSSLCL